MNIAKISAAALAVAGVCFSALSANAAVTTSPTAPAVGPLDIAKTTAASFRNSNDDDEGQRGPGQYFTTDSAVAGYKLPSFSYKNRDTNPSGQNVTVRIGTYVPTNSINGVFTQIASEAFTIPGGTGAADWITFIFSPTTNTAVTLAPSTTYAVRLDSGFQVKWQNTNENTVPNAGWFNTAGGNFNQPQDRLFVADLEVVSVGVPEPTSLALFGAIGGAALLRRRRR